MGDRGVSFDPSSTMPKGMGMEMGKIISRHRSRSDLMTEAERLLPRRWLNEYVLAPVYPGRNLGAIAADWAMSADPESDDLSVGSWYYPIGASRWGIFRGLMTSRMKTAVDEATNGFIDPATFVMQAAPTLTGPQQGLEASSFRVSTSMFCLPPRPIGETAGNVDGLYLVTLVDERWFFQGSPATLHPDKDSTWEDFANSVANQLGILLSFDPIPSSYGRPETDSQLWANFEYGAVLLDAIALNVGRVVVRKLDGTYALEDPNSSAAIVTSNRGNARTVIRMAGGDIFGQGQGLPGGSNQNARNAVVPRSIWVTFPKYVTGNDPVPHYLNSRYQNQRPSSWYEESYGEVHAVNVPILSGGPLVSGLTGVNTTTTIHSTAKALCSGEVQAASGVLPLNSSGLNALAMQIAQDSYGQQVAASLDEAYPGTFAWEPEGVHDVIWTYSDLAGEAKTRVVRSEWNQAVREMQHGTPALSGTTQVVRGAGGHSVAQTWRDSSSGSAESALYTDLTASGSQAVLYNPLPFPISDRWKGRISSGLFDDETALFEGTSGLAITGIAQRGIDGTIAQSHLAGSPVNQVYPNTVYGVNLVTLSDRFVLCQDATTSGGIQEVCIDMAPSTADPITESDSYGADKVFLLPPNSTTLSGALNPGDPAAILALTSGFPVATPWIGVVSSGQIYSESIAFQGVSSGGVAPIIARGLSGTTEAIHPAGDGVNYLGGTDHAPIIAPPSTTLIYPLGASDSVAVFSGINYLPTQNRWRGIVSSGQVNAELVLFEGTSGGLSGINGSFSVGIVARGIDGSTPLPHFSGEAIAEVQPHNVSGAILVKYEKGQFIYPQEYAGATQGVRVVPQTQTVQCQDDGSLPINGIDHFSGQVFLYDPSESSGTQFEPLENCWLVERNGGTLTSGRQYNGTFVGYSAGITQGAIVTSGMPTPPDTLLPVAPIYVVDEATGGSIVVRKNSAGPDFGPEPRLNFIEGVGIGITMADDLVDNEIDITFTSTGGGGSSCWPAYAAALDIDQNDYNPSALLWWRLTRGAAPANVNITGIVAGGDGCPILITHEGLTGGGSTTNTITLKGSSTTSSANNRFTPAGDIVLKDGDSVLVRYDVGLNRHRFIYYPAASSTQAGLVSLSPQSMGTGAKYFSDKVGVGTASPLANSALDVRGYTYAYFAGIISFGGGNTPASESDGAILQYASASSSISLSFSAAPGQVEGILIDGSNARFVLRHRTAAGRKFAYYNDDTSTYEDGITGNVNLARLAPAGSPGVLSFRGGILIGFTPPT